MILLVIVLINPAIGHFFWTVVTFTLFFLILKKIRLETDSECS